MQKTYPRRCNIFNCDRRHGNICCADCGYRDKNCKNPCLNHIQPDKSSHSLLECSLCKMKCSPSWPAGASGAEVC